MERIKRISILFLMIAVAAACRSLPTKSYFHLAPPAGGQAGVSTVEKTVFVEPVDVEPFYNDFRIVYRLSDYEVRYYSTDYWVAKPAAMFMSVVTAKRSGDRVLPGIAIVDDKAGAELILKMKVKVIEEIDGAKVWMARLAMDIEFRDAVSGERLVRHSFDRKAEMKLKNVRALPAALSGVFFEELGKAGAELAEKLATRGRG